MRPALILVVSVLSSIALTFYVTINFHSSFNPESKLAETDIPLSNQYR